MDEKSAKLLSAIGGICGGSYKIIEEDELLRLLGEGGTVQRLRELISDLEEKRFIDVRYADDGEYCVCDLPDGTRRLKHESDEVRELKRSRLVTSFLFAGSSFLGGLLGALLACAIVL